MSLTATLRSQLARRAPRLDDWVAHSQWKRRNRDRAGGIEVPSDLRDLVDELSREGVAISDVETVFGDRSVFDAAAAEARRRYENRRAEGGDATAGTKDVFLTKLGDRTYAPDHPFARVALHPRALAVANGYLELRSTLRALDLWHTRPTSGPAIQTQLWHRDADDVVNVKMFVYFTNVDRSAGPLCYARGTHPFGSRRALPERNEQGRSTDEQMRAVAPAEVWTLCEGDPGTVVFADTCGYHKQLKPESSERLLLVAHYVSGSFFGRREVEIHAGEASLADDQFVAAFDRLPPR